MTTAVSWFHVVRQTQPTNLTLPWEILPTDCKSMDPARNSNDPTAIYVLELPPEIWNLVFRLALEAVDLPTWIKSWMVVSLSWKYILGAIIRDRYYAQQTFSDTFLACFTDLDYLYLDSSSNITNEGLMKMTNLTMLCLDIPVPPDYQLEMLPQLHTLRLFSSVIPKLEHLTRLTRLYLTDMPSQNLDEMTQLERERKSAFTTHFSMLHALQDFRARSGTTDLHHTTRLTSLTCLEIPSDATVWSLGIGVKLSSLSIGTEISLYKGDLRHLRYLDVSFDPHAQLYPFHELPQLMHLSMSSHCMAKMTSMATLSRLRSVQVTGSYEELQLTDQINQLSQLSRLGLISGFIVRHLDNLCLDHFSICLNYDLDPRALVKMTSITSLELSSHLTGIEDQYLMQMTQLKYLQLHDDTLVTDKSMQHLTGLVYLKIATPHLGEDQLAIFSSTITLASLSMLHNLTELQLNRPISVDISRYTSVFNVVKTNVVDTFGHIVRT